MLRKPFADRAAAGRELAKLLKEYRQRTDVVVLALPRGGVPVACEIAQLLDVPLDVLIVRKLGAPGQPEFALGAIASGGITVVNEETLPWLADTPAFDAVVTAERDELKRREHLYRSSRPTQKISNRTVILVDDGAATGSSMQAAVRAARTQGAAQIVVALPIASRGACDKLREEADRVVCIHIPISFVAVDQGYENFAQTTDEEVQQLLARANEQR